MFSSSPDNTNKLFDLKRPTPLDASRHRRPVVLSDKGKCARPKGMNSSIFGECDENVPKKK